MSRLAEFAWGLGERPEEEEAEPVEPGHAEVLNAIPGDERARDPNSGWGQTRQERWMPKPVTLSRGWANW